MFAGGDVLNHALLQEDELHETLPEHRAEVIPCAGWWFEGMVQGTPQRWGVQTEAYGRVRARIWAVSRRGPDELGLRATELRTLRNRSKKSATFAPTGFLKKNREFFWKIVFNILHTATLT